MSAVDPAFGAADLTNCDREPIHIPGSIQPYGVLLVLERRSLVIEQLAGDTRFLLGVDPARLLGMPVSKILDPEAIAFLNALLESSSGFIAPSIRLAVRAQSGSLLLDLTAHATDSIVIVELEPARRTGTLTADPFPHLETLIKGFQQASSLEELCNVATTTLREITGFGRVMVYQFLEDGTGTVVAESVAAGVDSFLGLRYPASDIPKQARELYRRNWLRGTPDIDCVVAPVTPALNPRTKLPIDMSSCSLRSMSPIHVEYLRNMGVCASLSVSIVLADRLWGLFALHDAAPHHVPADLRVALQVFAHMFSLQVEAKAQADDARRRTRAQQIREHLVAPLVAGGEPGEALATSELLDYVDATGAALIFGGKVTTVGQTPTATEIEALARWLSVDGPSVHATDGLSQQYPPASGFPDLASGLLALSLGHEPRDFVLWFRPQIINTVRWGGEPTKSVTVGPLGSRLTPRASFAEWRVEQRNRSAPWAPVDVESAWTLRAVILDAAMQTSAARIHGMFKAMTEGLVLHGPGGAIIDANPAAAKILGLTREQLLGRTLTDPRWEAIREDETPLPGSEHPAMAALRTAQPLRDQIMGVRSPSRALNWISINAQPVFTTDSAVPSAVVTTFVDVTEARRLTEQIRTARTDLQSILDNVPARITAWNADSTNRFANLVALSQFGLKSGDATGKHFRDVLGAERYKEAQPFIEAALAGRRQSQEYIEPQQDGSLRYSHIEYVPNMRDGRVVGLYELATDVTALRESHRRVQELAQRLETAREDERRAVALSLHEGVAQDLFALKLAMHQLETESKGSSGVQAACRALAEGIDQCIASTRQIAEDLRPTALAHLHLRQALEQHAKWFGALTGLTIEVEAVADPAARPLDESTQLMFFRAAQEALMNVSRHARARRVQIRLGGDAASVSMQVIDDGVGISPGDLDSTEGLGLLGIRERFEALNGTLVVKRNAGSGTTVSIWLPLPAVPDAQEVNPASHQDRDPA